MGWQASFNSTKTATRITMIVRPVFVCLMVCMALASNLADALGVAQDTREGQPRAAARILLERDLPTQRQLVGGVPIDAQPASRSLSPKVTRDPQTDLLFQSSHARRT